MEYQFFEDVFLRTPFFSYARYDQQRLPEVLGYPVFRNALLLASPVLYAELAKRNFDYDHLTARQKVSLAKYYNRMCFRPTPFGGFAAFTLLTWSTAETLQLAGEPDCRLMLLPDRADLKSSIGDYLVVNPSLYRLGKTWRYYRSRREPDGSYRFSINALDAVRLNNELLRRCRTPASRADLQDWLIKVTHCTVTEARDYISFLLEDEVLLSADRASPLGHDKAVSVPANDPLSPGAYYATVERPVVRGGASAPDREMLSAILSQLQRLAVPVASPGLRKFTQDFRQRFDLRKVPLLKALDPDCGVAFTDAQAVTANDRPFGLEDAAARLPFRAGGGWTDLQQLLFHLWTAGGGFKRQPIVLLPEHLNDLPENKGKLMPNSLAVMFRQTVAGLQLEHVGGVTATQLLGRFSIFSDAVANCCRKIAASEIEANPGVIFADIGQRSHDHYDNINRRQPIYEYEIPLNVYSSYAPAQQLNPDDLLLSVRGDELILESVRLQKRVVPRLASAYNYRHTHLAVFQLLCELQYQGVAASWLPDLEALFPGMDYYPRLQLEDVVLAPARWIFRKEVWIGLQTDTVAAFRREHLLPDMVTIGTGDQQLVFDLSSVEDLTLLLNMTAGSSRVSLNEYLAPQKTVRSGNKPLAAQFVAFQGHGQTVYPGLPAGSEVGYSSVDREMAPGSDWLYLKIYCTPLMADRLLREVVQPVLRQLQRHLRGWFFIRYADPEYHLRLRFQLQAEDNGVLLAALQAQLKRRQLTEVIRGFLADTYQRELERYGVQWILKVEKVFEAGSNLVLRQLASKVPSSLLDKALGLSLEMIRCFFKEPEDQLLFVQQLSDSFQLEFKTSKSDRLTFDRLYRNCRINYAGNARLFLREIKVLNAAMSSSGAGARRLMLADLIHMQLNRHFAEDQRKQELLVYYFLNKLIRAQQARMKHSGSFADQ